MHGRVLLLALVAGVLAVCAPASASARDCGAVLGEGTPYDIVAVGVGCAAAKSVADQATKMPSYGGCGVFRGTRVVLRQPCRVGVYRCRTLGSAEDRFHSRSTCRAPGGRRVTFTQG